MSMNFSTAVSAPSQSPSLREKAITCWWNHVSCCGCFGICLAHLKHVGDEIVEVLPVGLVEREDDRNRGLKSSHPDLLGMLVTKTLCQELFDVCEVRTEAFVQKVG